MHRLLAQLALPSGMAVIMAKESIAPQLKDFIGTGPYKFKERKSRPVHRAGAP
jgi:peptide/nickel transport system substrate-binding protein